MKKIKLPPLLSKNDKTPPPKKKVKRHKDTIIDIEKDVKK